MQTNRASNSLSRRLLGAFGVLILFGLLGAAISYFGWMVAEGAALSTSWPTADGVITSHKIDRHRTEDGGDTYKPQVAYEYAVDGVLYNGSRITFVDIVGYGTDDAAEDRMASYPVGTTVKVYYDPSNAGISVLEPGVNVTSFAFIIVGLCVIGLAVIPLLRIPFSYVLRRKNQ